MFLTSIIIASSALAAAASPLITYDSNQKHIMSKRDLPEGWLNSHWIMIFTGLYFELAMNIAGTLFIFYHTYKRWSEHRANGLAMSYRLPFYTAISDGFITLTTVLNITHTVINLQPWSEPYCSMVSAVSGFAVNFNNALFTTVAVITYLRVSFRANLNFGRHDWKLFAISLSFGLLTTFPFYDSYGGQAFWCINKPDRRAYIWFTLSVLVTCMIIATVCYLLILRLLKKNRQEMGASHARDHNSRIDDRVTRKISSYVLVFLFQWIPVTIYIVTFLAEVHEIWPLVFTTMGINIGGIGNALAYGYLEGMIGSRKSSSWSDRDTQSTKIPNQDQIKMTVVIEETHIQTPKIPELKNHSFRLPEEKDDDSTL